MPASDTEVVETLPAGAADRGLRAMRAALARDPGDLRLAIAVARRLIERGRASGDPRQFGHAQAALARWWAGDQPEVLLLRATILQNRHEFDAALADLQRLLAQRPHDAQAWLLRATLEQVQGRFAQASGSCAGLAASAAHMPQAAEAVALAAAACDAEVRSLTGDAPAAYRELAARIEGAATAGTAPSLGAAAPAPATRAWLHTLLAEMAERLGRAADAERHYRAAMATEPSPYLLAAYADLLLDTNRPREALALLARAAGAGGSRGRASLDEMPDALLLRVALGRHASRDPDTATSVAAMRERFAAARLRGDMLHGREEARFALVIDGDAARAARLAAEQWRRQREPADARIALLAARAAGRTELADEVRAFVRAVGLRDARLEPLLGEERP